MAGSENVFLILFQNMSNVHHVGYRWSCHEILGWFSQEWGFRHKKLNFLLNPYLEGVLHWKLFCCIKGQNTVSHKSFSMHIDFSRCVNKIHAFSPYRIQILSSSFREDIFIIFFLLFASFEQNNGAYGKQDDIIRPNIGWRDLWVQFSARRRQLNLY